MTQTNPSRSNVGARVAELARAAANDAKKAHKLVDHRDLYDKLGMTPSQIADHKRYGYIQAQMVVGVGSIKFDLFDLQTVKDAIARRKREASEGRSTRATARHQANRAAKPKTVVQIVPIPTKTPLVSTKLPQPTVNKHVAKAPEKRALDAMLAECWNLDRRASLAEWREIVRDYNHQGYKRK